MSNLSPISECELDVTVGGEDGGCGDGGCGVGDGGLGIAGDIGSIGLDASSIDGSSLVGPAEGCPCGVDWGDGGIGAGGAL